MITRWTFFRVKLIFECDFEICWSLGPWDPWIFALLDLFPPPYLLILPQYDFEICWSLGPWDPWIFALLDLFPPPYLLILSLTSSYSPVLVWFGMGGG